MTMENGQTPEKYMFFEEDASEILILVEKKLKCRKDKK